MKCLLKGLLLISFLSSSFMATTAYSLNQAETMLIEAAVKAIMKTQVGKGGTNFKELIDSIDCNKVSCSPKAVCQYLNVGSYFPTDCSQMSDQVQTKQGISKEMVIAALPEPESCANIASQIIPGQLIIGGLHPALQQCLNDTQAQAEMVRRNWLDIQIKYGLVSSNAPGVWKPWNPRG